MVVCLRFGSAFTHLSSWCTQFEGVLGPVCVGGWSLDSVSVTVCVTANRITANRTRPNTQASSLCSKVITSSPALWPWRIYRK